MFPKIVINVDEQSLAQESLRRVVKYWGKPLDELKSPEYEAKLDKFRFYMNECLKDFTPKPYTMVVDVDKRGWIGFGCLEYNWSNDLVHLLESYFNLIYIRDKGVTKHHEYRDGEIIEYMVLIKEFIVN